MMVASIGMQFFNNYANSKKNTEIQEKQREFQKAAAEHDFERMRKLQAESAKLALELEAEVHKERVEDINSNYDSLLENFAHSFTIQNWPLNVLPFIMKGESFGSLFNGTAQSINLHCIFTPSNCDWFNEMFYDDIDLRLEAKMNNTWNAQSTHPIVYYGGGWNRRSLKHGVSQPNLIDLDDIGLLETHLKNIPVLVVTPYFDPWLHFRVKLWGMGKDCELPFRIDIPHGNIEKQKRIFSYDYNKETKVEMTDDFLNNTIEELVSYLESLIGFVADKYFWGMYGVAPILPTILKSSPLVNITNIYIPHYISYAEEKLLQQKLSSLQDIKNDTSYIEAIRDFSSSKKVQTIEDKFIKTIHDTYIPMQEGNTYPEKMDDVNNFIKKEQFYVEAFSWEKNPTNGNDVYRERLDLIEYLNLFKNFVKDNSGRLNLETISIYIKHNDFKVFEMHVYDADRKCFLNAANGFDFCLSTNRPLHYKKIKDIFKNNNPGVIVCRYCRLDKLNNELINNDSLIF